MTLLRRALAEGLGTALLLAAVVGSGIMGEQLSGGNNAMALLANSVATGLALFALIVAFAPRSGAHFNPVVTVLLAIRREVARADIAPYLAAQFTGAILGVLLAHAMFDLPLLQTSIRERASVGQWISETCRDRLLHRRCLLVYRFHFIRESRSHVAPFIGAQVVGATLGAFADHLLSARGLDRS